MVEVQKRYQSTNTTHCTLPSLNKLILQCLFTLVVLTDLTKLTITKTKDISVIHFSKYKTLCQLICLYSSRLKCFSYQVLCLKFSFNDLRVREDVPSLSSRLEELRQKEIMQVREAKSHISQMEAPGDSVCFSRTARCLNPDPLIKQQPPSTLHRPHLIGNT